MDTPKADDVRWFDEHVMPHERDLRAYLRRYSHVAEVDDVVQESFLRLIRARRTKTISNARAYLFRTARNAVWALFRRPNIVVSGTGAECDNPQVVMDGEDVAERVIRQEELGLLLDAIKALPPRCREVFILRKIHGLSQREIAANLGIGEHTVQTQVARGARKCAEYFRSRQ